MSFFLHVYVFICLCVCVCAFVCLLCAIYQCLFVCEYMSQSASIFLFQFFFCMHVGWSVHEGLNNATAPINCASLVRSVRPSVSAFVPVLVSL